MRTRRSQPTWLVATLTSACMFLAACGAAGEAPTAQADIETDGDNAENGQASDTANDSAEGEADPAAPTATEATADESGVATVFETIDIGADWCLSQTVLPIEPPEGFFWQRLAISPSGEYMPLPTATGTDLYSLADRKVQESLSGLTSSNFVDGTDSAWFSSSDGDYQLWSPAEGLRSVPIERRSPAEVIFAPSSMSADGSVIAVESYPEGTQDTAPIVETRIVNLDTGTDYGVYPDFTVVLPDGERIVVPLISDSFHQDEWAIEDLASGEELGRLPGRDRLIVSNNGRWLFTHLSDYDADRADRGSSYAFAIEDLPTPVATFPGRVVAASPDGRHVFTVTVGSFDDQGLRLDTFGLFNTASGDAVTDQFTAAGDVFDHPVDFSHDSRFVATWAETSAGTGVHVVDLDAGELLTVVPANADPSISFDPNDDTLYIVDRRTGQFGHVDLSNGTVIVGESLFSFLNYQAVTAAKDTVIYPAPDGSWLQCELRTAEDGPGDGSGPDLPVPDPGQGITREMVLNALIPADHCQSAGVEPVQLVDGELVEKFDGWTERTWIESEDPNRLVIGDLNGDNYDDAVFVVSCNYGGNANFESIFIWIAGWELQELSLDEASQGLSYTGGYLSHMGDVEVSGSIVRASWLGNLRDDAACCPSIDMVSVFRVSRLGHAHFLRNEAQNEASELYQELS